LFIASVAFDLRAILATDPVSSSLFSLRSCRALMLGGRGQWWRTGLGDLVSRQPLGDGHFAISAE
jgi:hypothetical protein